VARLTCPYSAPARSRGPALNSQTLRQFLGLLLLMFSVSLMPACAIATLGQENGTLAWLILAGVTATSGLMLWSPGRHTPMQLRTRDGFLIVAGFWILLSLLDALPLYILLPIHFVDALFESISGFTTTGATVLAGLDGLPHALLYYRQQLQWIGGIGMIVSAVAVLPLIGVGGMQLLRAETSGPMKDDKLAPRISKTARYLWSIYGGLTLLCALAYLLAGMTPFDAVCHAMSTLSTGGFSTHDANLAYFHSNSVDLIACFFMMLGSVPFTLHYLSLHNRSFRPYRQHAETRIFFGIVLLAVGLAWALIRSSGFLQGLEAWRAAAFAVISAITSTGFMDEDFTHWPSVLPVLLIYLSCIGGCAGSTAGGIKIVRCIVLARQGALEVLRPVHPNLVRTLKHDGRALQPRVSDAVWAFFSVYVLFFGLLMAISVMSGLDYISAFGAVATTLNNLGPGLGATSASFAFISDPMKLVFAFSMLLGRLEFFTLLVLFHPAFWRR
jgi:trk system potassium uptake protein TrkH